MVYVSEDYGFNWSKIGHNIPDEPVNVIIEDLKNEKLIYVGTDHGLHASLDYGNLFFAFSSGLPNAPVHDLVIHPRENDLIVCTHGRSIYVTNIGGPLKYLENKWFFKNIKENSEVHFQINFELHNKILNTFMIKFFDIGLNRIADSFEKRAIYLFKRI